MGDPTFVSFCYPNFLSEALLQKSQCSCPACRRHKGRFLGSEKGGMVFVEIDIIEILKAKTSLSIMNYPEFKYFGRFHQPSIWFIHQTGYLFFFLGRGVPCLAREKTHLTSFDQTEII